MQNNPIYDNNFVKHGSNWIIVDLDGTLTDFSHRSHLIHRARAKSGNSTLETHVFGEAAAPDWNAFNNEAINDTCKEAIANIVRFHSVMNYGIAIITGRNTKYADVSLEWLRRNNIPVDLLLMREYGDWRADVVVKQELYEKFLRNNVTVHFCLEDRDGVTALWRSLGLTCLQVMEGEY